MSNKTKEERMKCAKRQEDKQRKRKKKERKFGNMELKCRKEVKKSNVAAVKGRKQQRH